MLILVVLSLKSPDSTNLFARCRIDTGVSQMICNAAFRRRIPLEVKLLAGEATKMILFDVEITGWYASNSNRESDSKSQVCKLYNVYYSD